MSGQGLGPNDLQRRSEGAFDSRTLLAVVLSIGIWTGWTALFPPEPVPEDAAAATEAPVPAPAAAVAAAAAPAPVPAAVEVKDVPFEMCGAKGVVNTATGALRDMILVDQLDRYHAQTPLGWAQTGFSGPWLPYGEQPGNVRLLSADAHALVAGVGGEAVPVTVEEQAPGRLITVGTTADGVEVRRTIQEVPAKDDRPCTLAVEVTWTARGAVASGPVWLGVHDVVEPSTGSYEIGMHPIGSGDGDIVAQADASKYTEPMPIEGSVDWFGFNNQYFAAVVAPGTAESPGEGTAKLDQRGGASDPSATPQLGVTYTAASTVAPGTAIRQSFTMYLGSKRIADLSAVDERLSGLVQLGFFSFFAMPLLHLLSFIHSYVSDWALSIVGLTFLVKTVFFPLSQQSFVSSQKMQAVQPELNAIREKHKDNPEELNRQTMLLFRERGVNPMAGCLPMLVQTPVWIALYSVLQTSVELYHASFLYIRDLTAPDPYMVLPLLVTGLMAGQQRMMPTGNMDAQTAMMMKWMPVVFGVIFFSLPAGLLLYIFVNTTLSIAQQWYIKATYQPETTTVALSGG